jgi:hypothetical protein
MARKSKTMAQRAALLAACGIIAGMQLAVFAAEPASGSPPANEDAIDPVQMQQMLKQAPLSKAAHALRSHVIEQGGDGFTSVRLEDDAVVLRWKGDVPADVEKLIASVSPETDVRIEPWAYSRAELDAAGNRIGDFIEAGKLWGQPYHGVWLVDDATIQVDVIAGTNLADARAALPAIAVPLTVAEAPRFSFDRRSASADTRPDAGVMVDYWRGDDAPPWSGGAIIITKRNGVVRGGSCSSGFSIWSRLTPQFRGHLTAAHCASTGDYITDGKGEYIGPVTNEAWRQDLLVYRTDQGAAPNIYWGWKFTSFTRNVAGWSWTSAGEWVCHSGAFSYYTPMCGMRVTNVRSYPVWTCDSDGDCFTVYNLSLATRSDSQEASVNGDSGGPVVVATGDNRVIAKGIIWGHSGNRLIYQDFGIAATNGWRLEPLTAP